MWTTYLKNCLLFVAALGLGSRMIYPLFPTPAFMRTELDFFVQHKDEYDTLILGSSVMRRGVIPAEFDRQMAELGHPTHSFNLAIPGMRSHELNYFMDQVLAMQPAKLKLIIVELDHFNPRIHVENRMAPRMVFWHDLSQSLLALHSIQLEEGPILEQVRSVRTHSMLLGAKATSIGQGPDLLEALRDKWQAQSNLDLANQRGWVPFTDDEIAGRGNSPMARNRHKLLEDPEAFLAEVDALVASNAGADSHETFNFDALSNREQLAEQAGIRILHVIPPHLDLLPDIHHAVQTGAIQNALDYHSPTRYPELYAIDAHFDRNHLNAGAAKTWSLMLATDVAERLN